MQRQKKKKIRKIPNYKKPNYRSENHSYQPNSGLTQHYIITGAILPEKKVK